MQLSAKLRAIAMVCLAIAVCVISREARADSYNIYKLSLSSGDILNVGLTDSGSLTTSAPVLATPSAPSGTKYTTFTPPSATTISYTLPPLTFDNGSTCSVSVAGLRSYGAGTCNNGREVFEAYAGNNVFPNLYLLEAGMPLQLLYVGPVGELMLDAMGDVGFLGEYGLDDSTNYLYYDTTSRAAVTPEPSSLILLLTGGMGTATVWRRRLRAKA